MKTARLLMPLLLVVMAAAGCKNDTLAPNSSGRKALLIRTWRTTQATINGQDAMAFSAATITYNADGTYKSTFPTSPDETGNWSLSSDETKLTMDPSQSDELVWEILELTSAKLHMKANYVINGQSSPWEYTGVPQ